MLEPLRPAAGVIRAWLIRPLFRPRVVIRPWVVLTLAAATAAGQQAPTPRGGGLVPGSGPRSGLTRDELFRSWDLDGDGTISRSEADLARARMRRQRLEMQLGSGLDPLTGLPRNTAAEPAAADGDGDDPLFRLPPETAPAPTRRPSENTLPGTSAPRLAAPPPTIPGPAPSSPPTPDVTQPTAAGPQPVRGPTTAPAGTARPGATDPTARSGRASWLPPRPLGPSTTGGPRAGAAAAVPGYGSTQRLDLNAGRLPADRPAPAPAGGGLVPSGRPPGRTGALILPGEGPGSSLPPGRGLPAPPPPPSYSPPRITAEEMGGYRP